MRAIINILVMMILIQCFSAMANVGNSVASDTGGKNAKIPYVKNDIAVLLNTINEFMISLMPEEEWKELVEEFGPIKGNYCGVDEIDKTFMTHCLSQLDCLCKEHSFGYSLKKSRSASRKFAEEIFSVPFKDFKNNRDYEKFLQSMVTILFAGKLIGENQYDLILAAHHLYKKSPRKARLVLDDLIDENQVFINKIEEIKDEKRKFEEEQGRLLARSAKNMSVGVQPFNMVFGLISFNYEYLITDWMSLRSRLSFFGSGLIAQTYLGFANAVDFSIFFGVGAKSYVLGEPFKFGVYLEPAFDVGYESVLDKNKINVIRDIGLVPSLLIGVDKVFSSGIHLDAGVGLGYHFGIPVGNSSPLNSDFKLWFFIPRFQASVGYAW
ncbi:MAG: hypothetical protein O2897_00400 [bacterium]|nr:hypothetical protein [bacterium]